MTFVKQPSEIFPVDLDALCLKKGALIPFQLEPFHSVQNGFDGIFRRSKYVCILNPEDELTTVMPRKEPVEEGRACAADVKIAGGAGRETGDDRLHEILDSFSDRIGLPNNGLLRISQLFTELKKQGPNALTTASGEDANRSVFVSTTFHDRPRAENSFQLNSKLAQSPIIWHYDERA